MAVLVFLSFAMAGGLPGFSLPGCSHIRAGGCGDSLAPFSPMGFQGTTQKESPGTQVAKPGLELSALAIVSGVASALQPGQRERNMLLAACWWSSQLTREIHELEALNFGSEAPMAQASFANAQRFTAKAAGFSRALLAVIAEDVRTWNVFMWAVVVLFALNVLFLLSLTVSIKSEIAALSQEQSAGIDQVARVTKNIADTSSSLTQAISDTRSGLQDDIAKLNTKVDALLQQAPAASTKVDALLQQAPTVSPPPAASPKISAKPRPPSSRSRAWPW